MKVLVTGAGGRTGQAVVPALARNAVHSGACCDERLCNFGIVGKGRPMQRRADEPVLCLQILTGRDQFLQPRDVSVLHRIVQRAGICRDGSRNEERSSEK